MQAKARQISYPYKKSIFNALFKRSLYGSKTVQNLTLFESLQLTATNLHIPTAVHYP